MDNASSQQPREGDLSWRLSSHPITLLFFLSFRIGEYSIEALTNFYSLVLGLSYPTSSETECQFC